MTLHEDDIFAKTPEDLERARERRVYTWMERERARHEALRRLDAELRGPVAPPALLTLRERLARPRPVATWRIHGWQPAGSRVMFAAQFKAGKTTLFGNYIRSLVDGDPFLGRDAVVPISGVFVHFDFEMSEWQLDDWLRDQHIRRDDQVIVESMRGKAASFDIINPEVRAQWAERLRRCGATNIGLDCLRPILDALGLDEHKDAGRFLVAFYALLNEAGITEANVVQHMGHVNERARGDSRLRDWPDVEWRLVRQDEDPASTRFLSAYGRDVDVPESQLTYDSLTRTLTLVGGSRADTKTTEALDAVRELLRTEAPLSGRAIKDAITSDSEHGRNAIEKALKTGRESGALLVQPGPRHSKLYTLGVSQCPGVSRQCPGDTESECPAAYIERDSRTVDQAQSDRVNHRDTHMPNGRPPFGISQEAWAARQAN
jgi:hypothetical protein